MHNVKMLCAVKKCLGVWRLAVARLWREAHARPSHDLPGHLLSPSAVLQTRSLARVPASANGAPLRFQRHGQRRITCCDGSDDYYGLRFDGVHRLLVGPERRRARLESARIVVVGLGGVGSWTVEALARSGVGSLVLIDLDEICISNTNRQLHALHDTVGRSKAKMLEARVLSINPECTVQVREEWVMPSNAHEILQEEAAAAAARGETLALVDAVDGFQEKASMVVAAFELGLHVVLVGAAGGKIDPTAVRVADLTEVTNDKLLRRVRQQLRKEHGFPPATRAACRGARWRADGAYRAYTRWRRRRRPLRARGLSATGSAPLASRPARLASPPPRTSPPRSQRGCRHQSGRASLRAPLQRRRCRWCQRHRGRRWVALWPRTMSRPPRWRQPPMTRSWAARQRSTAAAALEAGMVWARAPASHRDALRGVRAVRAVGGGGSSYRRAPLRLALPRAERRVRPPGGCRAGWRLHGLHRRA